MALVVVCVGASVALSVYLAFDTQLELNDSVRVYYFSRGFRLQHEY